MHLRMVSFDLNQEYHHEHRLLTVNNCLLDMIILSICFTGDMSYVGTCITHEEGLLIVLILGQCDVDQDQQLLILIFQIQPPNVFMLNNLHLVWLRILKLTMRILRIVADNLYFNFFKLNFFLSHLPTYFILYSSISLFTRTKKSSMT